MQRRRHRGLGTAGGTGRRSESGLPLASDSEDDELPWRSAVGDAASPRIVPESDSEEPDVRPDVRGRRKRRRTPAPGHRLHVATPCLDPDIRGPKKRRSGPRSSPEPDVAISNVQPPNHSLDPDKVADPDVKHLEGSNLPLDVESETDVKALQKTALFHPNCHRTALVVSSKPDVEERGPNPGAGGAKNARQMLVVDSDTYLEEAEFLPDVGCPKIRRTPPNMPKTPGVEMGTPNPDVGGPPNGCRTLVDSDTDVELEGSNAAVDGSKNGHQLLMVDSDTDVEEERAGPDVGIPQTQPTTQNVPKPQNIEVETNNPDVEGSQKGHQMLVVDSDTDVEENRGIPDVGHPKTHQASQHIPKIQINEMEMQNADVEGSQKGRQILMVDSDTDVEEDTSKPDVGTPKTHRATQNIPRNPLVETESPDPRAEGPQKEDWTLVVDSDTDVEENGVNPDVGCKKPHRTTPKTRKAPDAEARNPNPDVENPQNKCCDLEADSETDVEEDDLSQRVLHPKSHKTPQNTRKDPTVVMETPNPDVGGLSRGSVASNGDSDTDVEDLDALPNFGAPKPHGTTHEVMDTVAKVEAAPDVDPERPSRTNDPDVKVTFPHPDVRGPKAHSPVLNVESDTDVEDNGDIPDVGPVQGRQGAPGEPDVTMTPPNPDVSPPAGPLDSSDTDMEEVAPTPDVRGLRSQVRFQNPPHPDVAGPASSSNIDMEKADPKRCNLSPKRPRFPSKSEGMVPNRHALAPKPDVAAPKPDVGAQRRFGGTPARGRDPAGPPDVFTPNSPHLDPNRAGDADGGPGSDRATPGGDMAAAVTESDPDTEEDPDLFLEPTQSFLPPVAKGTAPGWDPEEPTQRFFLPEEEEEEEEKEQPPRDLPRDPLDACVPPPGHLRPQRGSPAVAAQSWDPEEPTQRFFLPEKEEEEEEEEEQPPRELPRDPQDACPPPPGHLRPQRGSPAVAAQSWDPEEPTQRFFLLEEKEEEEEEEEEEKEEQQPPRELPRDPQDACVPPPGHLRPQRGSPAVAAQSWDPEEPTQPFLPPSEEEEEEQPPQEPPVDAPDAWVSPPDACVPPRRLGTQHSSPAKATQSWDPEEPTQPFLPPREEEEEEQPPPKTPRAPPDACHPPPGHLRPQCGSPMRAAQGWDPEEPTQPFLPPREEEEPPPEPPRATSIPPAEPVPVPPAQEGTGTRAAPGGEVREGPRRSQRLARSRGGGASGGGVASRARGGATPDPAPVRRSPRLQAPPPPPEPPATRGRGQVEPRPPAKPRPRRGGHAPSQQQAQEEEEEPAEAVGPQLRPRGTPGSAPLKVLFTGVVASPDIEVALKTLGGSMATSVFDCTHLVTDRVRRTVKFLCAVARGVPIVTPEWLHKSARSGRVLLPGPFLVRDSQQERHFGFSLAQALRRARSHPLLQGYEVHVTPNVRPEPEHMRDIVTCSGGTFLPTMPHTYGPRRLVISCPADAGCWGPALSARLPLASAELLLTGLLRQRLQLQPFLLPPPATPPSPPTPPGVPTAPPGVPPHPFADAQEPPGTPGILRGTGEVTGGRSRNRRPPRDTPRDPPGTRRRPAAPPTRQ